MAEKVALITGASAGLGKATALELARMGWQVVILARPGARAQEALQELKKVSGKVEHLPADLSSMESVRKAAQSFKANHDRLDVLINNAGVYTKERKVTPDGLETMFATNHLGHFLLTHELLPVLKTAGAARVLTVSAPSTVKLNFEDLQGEKKFRSLIAFGASKAGNLLFGQALARKQQAAGITSNLFHPGLVKTDLMNEANFIIRLMTPIVSAPPEKSAAHLAYLASAPELKDITGKFFKGRTEIKFPAYSTDLQIQDRLWEASLKLAGVTE
jgi:NAD(P)-dependent dehydrogenase (short-subunit alcohol dehydrogenase family)